MQNLFRKQGLGHFSLGADRKERVSGRAQLWTAWIAAVDVYDKEPVGADEPLLKMDNVTCTPHLGYVTRESYEEYYAVVVDDIVAFAAGKPNHVLDPDVFGKK
jgi:phosphoglycerate dehydrogenase-like enzyme